MSRATFARQVQALPAWLSVAFCAHGPPPAITQRGHPAFDCSQAFDHRKRPSFWGSPQCLASMPLCALPADPVGTNSRHWLPPTLLFMDTLPVALLSQFGLPLEPFPHGWEVTGPGFGVVAMLWDTGRGTRHQLHLSGTTCFEPV